MINSYDYCLNCARAKPDTVDGLLMVCEDELVGIAEGVVESEKALKDLRAERWGYCAPVLNKSGKVEVAICDEASFKESVDSEARHVATIAQVRSLFMKLQPIFNEAVEKLPGLKVPTLKGLRELEIEAKNSAFMTERRLKQEAAERLSSVRGKGQSLEQVLNDPDWKAYVKDIEEKVSKLNNEAELCRQYTARIEEAMG